MSLSLAIVCLLTLASVASAADKSAENMPTVNPYLHDSHNPISHENPAQTDAVNIASGTRGRMLGADGEVLHATASQIALQSLKSGFQVV